MSEYRGAAVESDAEQAPFIVELIGKYDADGVLGYAGGIVLGKAGAEPFAFERVIVAGSEEGGCALAVFDGGQYVELFAKLAEELEYLEYFGVHGGKCLKVCKVWRGLRVALDNLARLGVYDNQRYKAGLVGVGLVGQSCEALVRGYSSAP